MASILSPPQCVKTWLVIVEESPVSHQWPDFRDYCRPPMFWYGKVIVNSGNNGINSGKISSITVYNKTIHDSKDTYMEPLDPTFVQEIDLSQPGLVGKLTAVVNAIVSETVVLKLISQVSWTFTVSMSFNCYLLHILDSFIHSCSKVIGFITQSYKVLVICA